MELKGRLTFGRGDCTRVVTDPADLLIRYRNDIGYDYYSFRSAIPDDVLLPEDLAGTLLVNSQAGWRACQSLQRHGREIDLRALPRTPLEVATTAEQHLVSDIII